MTNTLTRPTKVLSSLCALCIVSLAAQAQQELDNDRQAQPSNQLERVEVRGQRPGETEMRRRQPVAKQIYGREELDKYGDNQLSDVLKRLPGINVTGGQLRMRGLGGAYTQILVNGEPAPPGFSLDNLSPAQVERLEVSKAPTADQSAQAIAGTLNVVLKEAPRSVQKDLRVGVGYNDDKPVVNGNFTYGDRTAGVGGMGYVLPISFYQWRLRNETSGDRLGRDAGGQAQRLRTEGFDIPYGHGLNFSPRLNWKLAEEETLSLQGFFVRNNFRNKGESDTLVVLGRPPTNLFDRFTNRGHFSAWRGSLQYNNRLDDDTRIELRVSGSGGGANFANQFLGRDAAGVAVTDRRTDGQGKNKGFQAGGKYIRLLGDSQTITAGAELERRTRQEQRSTLENGVELLPGIEGQPFDATSTRSAAYLQNEWEINPQWSTYLGLRHESIRLQSEGVGSRLRSDSNVTTPSIHLNYKLDPKGRDLIRASLTRSYKAPDVQQLIARPTINTNYPTNGPNTETAPDRLGNPELKPELATGIDVAWETYLKGGSLVSVSVFHRRLTDLVRSGLKQQSVPWASVPRWVAMPINLSRADTSGLELEIKGRAGELMPSWFDPATALNLRLALSMYHSKVKDIPGPNNRLEQQQPWSVNLGLDYRLKTAPVSIGASLAFTPGYEVQQTSLQALDTGRSRTIDAFAMWNVDKANTLRITANNFQALDQRSNTLLSNGDFNWTERRPKAWYGINWEHKF
jgi:outer membrane receptor for ferrienterochelin and colicins